MSSDTVRPDSIQRSVSRRHFTAGTAAMMSGPITLGKGDKLSTLASDKSGLPIFQQELELKPSGVPTSLCWSPDSGKLAASSMYGVVTTVWDATGHVINKINHSGGGPAVEDSTRFVNDSGALAYPAVEPGFVEIADAATGRHLTQLPGANGKNIVIGLAVDFTMRLLAIMSANRAPNVIVYDTKDLTELYRVSVTAALTSCAFFGPKPILAIGGADGHIRCFDGYTGTLQHDLVPFPQSVFGSASVDSIAGSPDGTLLFAGAYAVDTNGGVDRRDAYTWSASIDRAKVLRMITGDIVTQYSMFQRPIHSAAWDPKDRFVVFSDYKQSLYVSQSPNKGTLSQTIELPSNSLTMAISPDGTRLAVGVANAIKLFSIN